MLPRVADQAGARSSLSRSRLGSPVASDPINIVLGALAHSPKCALPRIFPCLSARAACTRSQTAHLSVIACNWLPWARAA